MVENKIYLLMAMALFLVPCVSAWNWDNAKSYDEKTNEITITNALGLGEELTKIRLVENTYSCGSYCYAIIDIDNNEEIKFDNIKSSTFGINFYNVLGQDSNNQIKEYKLKIYVGMENVTRYDNKTGKTSVIGSKEIWKDIEWKGYTIPIGKTRLKLEGYRQDGMNARDIDWKLDLIGIRTDEWAWWSYANMTYYYDFNESAGIGGVNYTNDTTGKYNATISGTQVIIAGKTGNASDYARNCTGNNCTIDTLYQFSSGWETAGHSVTMFVKAPDTPETACKGATCNVLWTNGFTTAGGGGYGYWLQANTSEDMYINGYSGAGATGWYEGCAFKKVRDNAWHMIGWTWNSSQGIVCYQDGFKSSEPPPADFSTAPSTAVKLFGIITSSSFSWNGAIDQAILWNVVLNSSDIATLNGTTAPDTSPPNVIIISPNSTINVTWNNAGSLINFSVSDDSTINSCWYGIDGGTNVTLTSICNSSSALTYFTLATSTNGKHHINFYADDTSGNVGNASVDFFAFNYSFSVNKTTAGEGDTIEVNLTLDGLNINTLYPKNNATFYFNGISYIPTIDRTAQNYTYFTKTMNVPIGIGNSSGKTINYSWDFQIRIKPVSLWDGLSWIDYNPDYVGGTTNKTINIYNLTLSDCDITSGYQILNLSIKDEETTEFVNASSPNNTIVELSLNVTSRINSSQVWSFAKKWEHNQSIAICVPLGLLNDTSYKIDFTIGYEDLDRVKEFFYLDNGTLDNSTKFNPYTSKIIDLYDLLASDSTTFLFDYTDENGLKVDNAIVHTFRDYVGEGLFREVERSKQDNNGQTHVHLVEEDVIYYFMITKEGHVLFTSSTYNAKCLSTPCEITLSGSPTETNWSVIDNEGGKYNTNVNADTRITTITFNLDTPALVNTSLYKYINGTEILINSSSLNASIGTIELYAPLAYGNATYFVAIYKNNAFIKSSWVQLKESGKDYFGTFGAILAGFLLLSVMLMAVSEGAGFIVFTILALAIVGIMQLVSLSWLALISLIVAGGIIIWKLVSRRNKQG